MASKVSFHGRHATLVKSSVVSIPIYTMQTTHGLPQKISRQLDQLSCQFLWGDTHQRRSCHTVSWVTITLPKAVGGLGIQSVYHRNRAILTNQAWCLYHSPHMLWAQVLKAKFFPHTSLFEITSTSKGSQIWKALFNGIQWLCEGMKWMIGDGHNIRIWEDHWIPGAHALRSRIASPLMRNEENSQVSSLWVAQTWDLTSLHVPLPPQIKQLIHGILVARIARLSYTFVWPHNNGMCSVRWASHFIYQQQQVPLDK